MVRVVLYRPSLAFNLTLGDYYVAGLLDLPTVLDMGDIIHKINAGGVSGLCKMGFLDKDPKGKYNCGVVQEAFSKYYNWISSITSEAERLRWRWNVITAENHLCKHSRLYDEVVA